MRPLKFFLLSSLRRRGGGGSESSGKKYNPFPHNGPRKSGGEFPVKFCVFYPKDTLDQLILSSFKTQELTLMKRFRR